MYAWVLAWHLIAVVCWFAALFYLPRLFVYHAMSDDQISRDRFVVMERKLYRGIGTPAMIATVVLGGWLVALNPDYYLSQRWFQIKAVIVALLIGYHLDCRQHMLALRDERSDKSHVYFRWFNEAPVLALIAVVILVIVKPFSG